MRVRPTLRERLANQRALLGLLQTQPNPTISELAAMCGYDFVVLDGEHGLFGDQDYLQTLQALSFCEVAVFIRVGSHDAGAIGRCLDLGADGIVAPNVSTAEQAHALARAMEYPPRGTRGFGAAAHRITRYGEDVSAHLQQPRASASLVVVIESAQGVANAEAILAVDGVDAALVGPADLSADLGFLGNYSNAAYTTALIQVEAAASSQGKIIGTAPHPGNSLEALLSRGHRLLILGVDTTLVRDAMRSQVTKAKCHL